MRPIIVSLAIALALPMIGSAAEPGLNPYLAITTGMSLAEAEPLIIDGYGPITRRLAFMQDGSAVADGDSPALLITAESPNDTPEKLSTFLFCNGAMAGFSGTITVAQAASLEALTFPSASPVEVRLTNRGVQLTLDQRQILLDYRDLGTKASLVYLVMPRPEFQRAAFYRYCADR